MWAKYDIGPILLQRILITRHVENLNSVKHPFILRSGLVPSIQIPW